MLFVLTAATGPDNERTDEPTAADDVPLLGTYYGDNLRCIHQRLLLYLSSASYLVLVPSFAPVAGRA